VATKEQAQDIIIKHSVQIGYKMKIFILRKIVLFDHKSCTVN